MMDENQKIQEALSAGYTLDEIRFLYIANNMPLPESLAISKAETAGKQLSKPAKLALTAVQGPTLGFGEEIGAGIVAPFMREPGESYSDAYRRLRDIQRSAVSSYKEEYPIGAPVVQGVASLPLGMLNLGRQMLPNVGAIRRAIGAGGVTGAISGAGEAETIADIPSEALETGATSAALGGVFETGAKVARPVIQAVTGQVARAVPEGFRQMVGGSSADIARRRVAQAMLRDGSTIEQVQARLNKLGDDAILADAAGYNLRDLLDTMATLPGRTKNYTEQLLKQRSAQRGERISESAQRQLSPTGARLADSVESLITKREVDSTPLYEQLRTINIQLDDDLRQILDASKKLGAFGRAEKISIGLRQPFTLKDLQKTTDVSMNDLDKVKRGLDDILGSKNAINERGEINEFGRSVYKLKQDLLKRLDDATLDKDSGQSLYKNARNAYAGPSALISATELGRTVISKPAATIRMLIKDMGDSELEAFRVGGYEALRELAGTKAGVTKLLGMWEERATREKLKEIFPSERAYRVFASDVAAEARKKELQSVGRGSPTAPREARMEDVGIETLKDTANIAAAAKTMDTSSLLNLLTQGMRRTSIPEPVRDEIGRILMSRATSGDEMRILRDVIARMRREQEQAGVTSGIIGTQVAPAAEPFTAALRSLLQ